MTRSTDRAWIRIYLAFAPVGTLTFTVVIICVAGVWPPWRDQINWEFAGKMVPLGAACYGVVISALEMVVIAMVAAWHQYKNWRKERQKDVLRALIESGTLSVSSITAADLRRLGLAKSDLEELREKELAQTSTS